MDESVELHPRSDDLRQVCRSGYEVNGCTDFPEEVLDCRCERHGESWFVDASARLRVLIHIPNTVDGVLIRAHEQRHITDLEESLTRHLDTIASRPFDSEEPCDRYARFLSTSSHLRVMMNEFRAASNVKFGCDIEGARKIAASRK